MNIHQRDPRKQRPCDQPYICVDDYGNAVFIGHYSEELVWAQDAKYFGPVMPQATNCYVDGKNGDIARKKSALIFNEFEANCNTCRHLERVPSKRGGLLYGKCQSHPIEHPYIRGPYKGGAFAFSPDDHMGMKCYQPR